MVNTINFIAAAVYMLLAAWNLTSAIKAWHEARYGWFSIDICLMLPFIFAAAKAIFVGF